MYRNFKVVGRGQLLLAAGHLLAVVHCQTLSGDGSYQRVFKNIMLFDFAKQNPILIYKDGLLVFSNVAFACYLTYP